MIRYGQVTIIWATVLLAGTLWVSPTAAAEPVRWGGWLEERDDRAGMRPMTTMTMELTLHPQGESRPALKHRLLPDEFEMVDGNAAVFYLKALGFLEENVARGRLSEVYAEANERTSEEDKEYYEVPPDAWQHMKPEQLPVEEVKEFLKLTSFQPPLLKEAAQRRQFDLDRNIRAVDDPIAYLLPEIQSMRALARLQAIRCRVAMAEGRLDDAIAILGQQYAMAHHLGQDEFLVSNLVGMACAGIAFNDVLCLVQRPDAPNLYWALASLPRPLFDLRHALAVERHLLGLQLKVLREVDETPRTAGYWRDFLDRLIPQIGMLRGELDMPSGMNDPETARAMLVGLIAAAYPGAKRYLIEDCGLSAEQVRAYPTAQVVFLAMVRYNEEAADDYLKWSQLPYWQAQSRIRRLSFDDLMQVAASRVGWSAWPAQRLLPAVQPSRTAAARIQQQLALAQTVESIRAYGAAHDGKLPATLDDLALPVPLEPFDGKPLDYRYHGQYAELSGHEMPGLRYRLVLRFAEEAQ